jgi:hypothetical protein
MVKVGKPSLRLQVTRRLEQLHNYLARPVVPALLQRGLANSIESNDTNLPHLSDTRFDGHERSGWLTPSKNEMLRRLLERLAKYLEARGPLGTTQTLIFDLGHQREAVSRCR